MQVTLDWCSTRGLSKEICNKNLMPDQASASHNEFVNFMEGSVKAVLNIENTRRHDRSSSLQVLCCVDVGVLQGKGGEFHYYINELERSLTVGLYRRP
jgi:hypothetical protein